MGTCRTSVMGLLALAACDPTEDTGGAGGAPVEQPDGGKGGSGGAGSGGAGSGGAAPCHLGSARIVAGCIVGPRIGMAASEEHLDATGSVTWIKHGDPSHTCLTPGVGGERDTVALRVEDASANAWDLAFIVPGVDGSSLHLGDTVTLAYAFSSNDGGGSGYYLSVRRDGRIVVSVGADDVDPEISVTGGDLRCAREGGSCGVEVRDMVVTIGAETATIANGATAEVAGLLVTNEHFANMISYGGCNAFDPSFNIGVAAHVGAP
jgi:hypothetical protein